MARILSKVWRNVVQRINYHIGKGEVTSDTLKKLHPDVKILPSGRLSTVQDNKVRDVIYNAVDTIFDAGSAIAEGLSNKYNQHVAKKRIISPEQKLATKLNKRLTALDAEADDRFLVLGNINGLNLDNRGYITPDSPILKDPERVRNLEDNLPTRTQVEEMRKQKIFDNIHADAEKLNTFIRAGEIFDKDISAYYEYINSHNDLFVSNKAELERMMKHIGYLGGKKQLTTADIEEVENRIAEMLKEEEEGYLGGY